jgi:pimeloyl-ACP methyl ester carboxylesterase
VRDERATSHHLRATVTVDTETAGPAFVLVHGIGVSTRYFERLVPALSVDLPGFGAAKWRRPPHPPSIEDFADSVAAALDALGISGATIVGHSMGTQIQVSLAGRRPDLVGGLALLGPVMAPEDRGPLRAGLLLGLDTLRESPRANRVVIGDYLHAGLFWYLATLPAMLGYRIEDELERIDVPTVVVRGSRDPIAHEGWVVDLARRAGGRAETVAGAAHLVMHGRPWRTAQLIAGVAP